MGLGRSYNNMMGRDERRQEGAIANQLHFGRASGELRGDRAERDGLLRVQPGRSAVL